MNSAMNTMQKHYLNLKKFLEGANNTIEWYDKPEIILSEDGKRISTMVSGWRIKCIPCP
jgi:hypothetical protein